MPKGGSAGQGRSPSSENRLGDTRDQREFVSLMASRVGDAHLREPLYLDGATDLVATCRALSQAGVADALVRDGDRLGIFTTTSLRDALLQGRAPEQIAVREFTSFSPWSVSAGDEVFDAMMLMLQHRIHRVLVRQDDRIIGILSQLDLMGFLANHSHLIGVGIAHATTVDQIGQAAAQVEALIRTLHDDGVRVEIIADTVGALNRQIFRRLWDLLAPQDLRENSCLIVMGSEGRSEQVIRTDQDNALILRDGFDFPGLADVTQAFTDALIGFGYPPCPGGIMVSRPLWCQPLQGFRDSLRDWVHGGDAEGPMNLAIFLDADAVAGDATLLADAQSYLRRLLTGSDAFYAHFARAIAQFGTEGRWWSRLPGMRGRDAAEVDVKKLGIFPLVHGVRTLALQYGIRDLGTADRLKALAAGGHLDGDFARDLLAALHCVMALKLSSNLRQIAEGRAPDNTIRLAELGTIERQSFRDSLTIVRRFKEWIARHYRLDTL